ncbi:unnamed protein product [Ixodes persulcatus]
MFLGIDVRRVITRSHVGSFSPFLSPLAQPRHLWRDTLTPPHPSLSLPLSPPPPTGATLKRQLLPLGCSGKASASCRAESTKGGSCATTAKGAGPRISRTRGSV